MMKRSLLVCSLVSGLVASPLSARDYLTSEQLPEWFNTSLEREARDLPRTRVSLPVFPINATAIGTWSNATQVDDYWYFTVDIGSESPVECWAFQDYDGLANSLVNMMKYAVSNISKAQEKVLDSQFNFSLDMSTMGDTPVFAYNLLYNLGEPEQRVSGLLKGMSAESANGLQVCLHNEIGYRETFKDVFASFINAVDRTSNPQPFFFAINCMKMHGELVGVVSEKFIKDADGDVEIVETTSLILPVDENTVASTDVRVRSWSRADGTLINAYQYAVENSELSSAMGVSKPDDKWLLEGEIQGKAISSELAFAGEFTSNFGAYLETQKLAASDKTLATYYIWSADTDHTQATATELKKNGTENGLLKLTADVIGFKVNYTVDEAYIMQNAEMKMGPMDFHISPMYVSGKPTEL